jgi:hypothetical protein
MQRLHLEVLKVEFNQFNVDADDSISMRDFAGSIVSAEPVGMYKERLEGLGKYQGRVSFSQFYDFNQSMVIFNHFSDTYKNA